MANQYFNGNVSHYITYLYVKYVETKIVKKIFLFNRECVNST